MSDPSDPAGKPAVDIPAGAPPTDLQVEDVVVGSGAGGVIGPNETLVFVVDLLDVR
jgi:hypothetical protein